jgi:protein required for attachment to host cells
MKHNAWMVVASGDKARIFKIISVGVLEEIHDFADPSARLKDADLTSDHAGRTSMTAHGSHHTKSAHTPPHVKEVAKFARQLADQLEMSRQKGSFEHLYLVAEPKFLGHLRQHLNPNTAHVVAGECAKDIVHEEIHHIWQHVPFAV